MKIAACESPSEIWGSREKPFQYTGFIPYVSYLENLSTREEDLLVYLCGVSRRVADKIGTELVILGVGSATNPRVMHHDVDVLMCPQDSDLREIYMLELESALRGENRGYLQANWIRSSAPIPDSNIFARLKLYFMDKDTPIYVDITGISTYSGSIEDWLEFHDRFGLGYTVIED